MAIVNESGHQPGAPLISMGGVIGLPGLGRRMRTEYFTVTSATQRQILDDNPKRIAALIYANNGGYNTTLYFTSNTDGPFARLETGDWVLLSKDTIPWTGPVWGVCSGLTGQAWIAEVSVP